MENAGAESVVLVLESDGEFLVQGMKNASGNVRVMMAEPLRQSRRRLEGHRELRDSHVRARRARGPGDTRQVPQRPVRAQPPSEVRAVRAGRSQGQAQRHHLSREQPGGGRVHAGSAGGAEHPDGADRRFHRERDALREAGAADPRNRGGERHAHEGDRRAQARGDRARSLPRPLGRARQGAHARARERTRAARRHVAAGRAWPRSPPVFCTTSAT